MGGARCAEKLFAKMTMSVLQAPMSFFETTPLGRILNRFTYDVEVLDVQVSLVNFKFFFDFKRQFVLILMFSCQQYVSL